MSIGIVRYVLLLNAAWSVNSLAHIWGGKPYDRSVRPGIVICKCSEELLMFTVLLEF
jgi:fatty-acid desaturase